jgi:hypothetical protein
MEKEPIIQSKLQNQDWYQELLEETKAAVVQTRFESNIRLLEGKWSVGKIVSDKVQTSQLAELPNEIAKDLKMSSNGLWKCVQFYLLFPEKEFESVPGRLSKLKNLTWLSVCKELLPPTVKRTRIKPTCEHKEFTCSGCKTKFNLAAIKEMMTEQF